jgi:hypothetical protein
MKMGINLHHHETRGYDQPIKPRSTVPKPKQATAPIRDPRDFGRSWDDQAGARNEFSQPAVIIGQNSCDGFMSLL